MEKLTPLKEGTAWARNQSTLNKLGETDGNLTFDGKPVGMSTERPTAQKVITQDDTNFVFVLDNVVTKCLFLCFSEEDGTISEGMEIADVEIACADIADGAYVSTRNMFPIDEVSYFIMNNRVYSSSYGYTVQSIFFPIGLNKIASAVDNFEWASARITYYTD